ncbi:hypothetical protein NIES4106_61400 (plasmid) [Fischerella sp. NIES-4106]|nr:hypothetical protein NIES4106_61400 [Fischerella sp. NIES-4106]
MTTLPQRKSPLTWHERQIISTTVNRANFATTAEDIWFVAVAVDVNTTWVMLYDGQRLPFNRDQFRAVANLICKSAA